MNILLYPKEKSTIRTRGIRLLGVHIGVHRSGFFFLLLQTFQLHHPLLATPTNSSQSDTLQVKSPLP